MFCGFIAWVCLIVSKTIDVRLLIFFIKLSCIFFFTLGIISSLYFIYINIWFS